MYHINTDTHKQNKHKTQIEIGDLGLDLDDAHDQYLSCVDHPLLDNKFSLVYANYGGGIDHTRC